MEESSEIDVENVESEKTLPTESPELTENVVSDKPKLIKLPLTRVKHIMKMDPDCSLISQDALFLVTKSTVKNCSWSTSPKNRRNSWGLVSEKLYKNAMLTPLSIMCLAYVFLMVL